MMSGSLTLDIYKGVEHERIFFGKDSGQILVRPGIWRVISSASKDAVLMVLANAPYDESDYIRDWDEYLAWFNSENANE
jgi:hypothetical protein